MATGAVRAAYAGLQAVTCALIFAIFPIKAFFAKYALAAAFFAIIASAVFTGTGLAIRAEFTLFALAADFIAIIVIFLGIFPAFVALVILVACGSA